MPVAEARMLKNYETAAVPCLTLLEDFARREQPRNGKLLNVVGTGGKDAYNCAVEVIDGELTLALRIESRLNALDAEIRFYRERADGAYEEISGAPVFAMEDPAIELIGGEIIVSGISTQWGKNNKGRPELLGFHTLFYRGKRLEDLHFFAEGPLGMKDIRLCELEDERIIVSTRPQLGDFGRGKIGFTIIDTLEELSPQRLTEATIIPGQFAPGEWGGVGKLRPLDKKTIGAIGHIAHEDIAQKDIVIENIAHEDSPLDYYGMTFMYDLETRTASPLRIIATRENFPPSEAKKPRLRNVVFPGGLLEKGGNEFVLYAGLSDAANGTTIVVNPF